MEIKDVVGRQILDSRGNPTIEVDVLLEDGSIGRASVPSGASSGAHEAVELRDGGKEYGGKGVHNAIAKVVDTLKPALLHIRADDQFKIDSIMIDLDGTDDKSHLGANAVLAVSLANAKAAAASRGIDFWRQIADIAGTTSSIPMPMVNVINGGVHTDAGADIQEFMIVPVGSTSIHQALQMSSEIFHELGNILANNGHRTLTGDEGGYSPSSGATTTSLDYILSAIAETGYMPLKDVSVALDVAASEMYFDNEYHLSREGKTLTGDELIASYIELCKTYPIISIEDGLAEDDWGHWTTLNSLLGNYINIVTDDLTVTNTLRLGKAIEHKSGNTVLLKPNQIGTLTETIKAFSLAKEAGWKTIFSHRSGDTEDTALAHIAVGLGADYIKSGSMSRSERLAKYNELLRISEHLPTYSAPFAKNQTI